MGNRAFVEGEDVWTEGNYAFGNNKRTSTQLNATGGGIIGDYFVIYKGSWYIVDANSFNYTLVTDTNKVGGQVSLYNAAADRFCGTSDIGVSVTSNFHYTELTKTEVKTHTIVLGTIDLGDVDAILTDAYYDTDGKPVFIFHSNYRYGYEEITSDGTGNITSKTSTSTPLYKYTVKGEDLTGEEAITGNLKAMAQNAYNSAFSDYTSAGIVWEDILEPTESDVVNYWNAKSEKEGTRITYEMNLWEVAWACDCVKDDANSVVSINAKSSSNKLYYPDDMAEDEASYHISFLLKPENAQGLAAIVLDDDYDSTIKATGFDDPDQLPNYYIKSTATGTPHVDYHYEYKSYYGKDVIIPASGSLPEGQYVVSKFIQSYSARLGGVDYAKREVQNSNYSWQDKQIFLCTLPTMIDKPTGADDIFPCNDTSDPLAPVTTDRHLLVRTAQINYTLKATEHDADGNVIGVTYPEKILYYTRRTKAVDYTTVDAVAKPSMDLEQKYHNGCTLKYNTRTTKLALTVGGNTFDMGTYSGFMFYLPNAPASALDTSRYTVLFDRINSKLIEKGKSGTADKDILTGLGPIMQQFSIINHVPLADLMFFLGPVNK